VIHSYAALAIKTISISYLCLATISRSARGVSTMMGHSVLHAIRMSSVVSQYILLDSYIHNNMEIMSAKTSGKKLLEHHRIQNWSKNLIFVLI
jgi:hypothetical protein